MDEERIGAVDPRPYDVYGYRALYVVAEPTAGVVLLEAVGGEVAYGSQSRMRLWRKGAGDWDGDIVWLVVVVDGEVEGVERVVIGEGELEEESEGDKRGGSYERDHSTAA